MMMTICGHTGLAVGQMPQRSARPRAEVPLAFLRESAVAAYLTQRVPGYQESAVLARIIHQRTDGNPLFMVHVVEELLTQGRVGEQEDSGVLDTRPEAD